MSVVVALEEVAVGDVVVVAAGDVVPVDGRILDSPAVLDESVLTGEPLPGGARTGGIGAQWCGNAGDPLEIRAAATAADSTYAGIVRLAQQTSAENAPVSRSADRYAAWFLPLVLPMAGVAYEVSGSAVRVVWVM